MTHCKKGIEERRETNDMSKPTSQVTWVESTKEFSAGEGWGQKVVGQGRGRRMGGPSRSVYCVHVLLFPLNAVKT